jgi:hypothetical protein
MMAWAPPSSAREIQSDVLAGTRTIGVKLSAHQLHSLRWMGEEQLTQPVGQIR